MRNQAFPCETDTWSARRVFYESFPLARLSLVSHAVGLFERCIRYFCIFLDRYSDSSERIYPDPIYFGCACFSPNPRGKDQRGNANT